MKCKKVTYNNNLIVRNLAKIRTSTHHLKLENELLWQPLAVLGELILYTTLARRYSCNKMCDIAHACVHFAWALVICNSYCRNRNI